MANVSRIYGLRPIGDLNGGPFNGQVSQFLVPAADGTALFVGDLVKLSGTASPDGFATVIKNTAPAGTNASVGVVVGFRVNPLNLNIDGQYRVASTDRYVLVSVDPNTLYVVQANGTPTVADVGLNVDISDAGGSTTTANSGVQADMSTKATTATLPLKIIGFSTAVDNDITAASSKLIVKINNHQYATGTGTVGL